MKALTFFLYYYGTVASCLLLAEANVYINTGTLFNPITNPMITVPIMILVALIMILPAVYYKWIKPLEGEEENIT